MKYVLPNVTLHHFQMAWKYLDISGFLGGLDTAFKLFISLLRITKYKVYIIQLQEFYMWRLMVE